MFTYYQPWLLPFLKFGTKSLPKNIKQTYYYSFEDGLWDLLRHNYPNKKVNFLVPDFYCSDVLDNIRRHGHDYIYYQLDKNFQITTDKLRRYLWLYQPDIVIIFHACGITSQLFLNKSWMADLPKESTVIEDSVHRLVNPEKIKLLNTNHLVMDSLRKVSPIPGSRMFGNVDFIPDRIYNLYFIKSSILYILFRIFLNLGFTNFAHQNLLGKHDDIIGDEYSSQTGLSIFKFLLAHLDYEKIESLKHSQIALYEKYLKPVYKNKFYYHIKFPKSDYKYLHVYPLGVVTDPQEKLVTYLHQQKILVWYKFTDSPWSTTRRVLFLPLGFHINESKIKAISSALINFISK